MMVTIKRALDVWGPGRKCVLCRALYALMPHPDPVDLPDEVASAAIAAGAADGISTESDGALPAPKKARRK